MRYVLALMLLALPAVAQDNTLNVDPRRMQQIYKVQAIQKQELYQRYQEDMSKATTPAAQSAVRDRYQSILDPNPNSIPTNIPQKQRLRLYEAQLNEYDTQMDYWREGDISPTVDSLTSEAAYDKGLETFRSDRDDETLDAIMDAHRQRLKDAPVRQW